MKKQPLVSIVVLNWNKKDDTIECLDSLKDQTYQNYEIILVDNGSKDGSKKYFANKKGFRLVDLPSNTGFTGGQIAGYKAAKGEFIALINNDAVAKDTWLEELMKCMQYPRVAVAGGPQYSWSDEHKKFDETSPLRSYFLVDPISAHTEPLYVGNRVESANSISGSGVIIRRKAIEKVGYFDDRFFAYYEEADLFARMKRAGYKVMYTPDAKIWHKVGESSKSNPMFYPYQMHRNRFLFAYKNFDANYKTEFVYTYFKEVFMAILHLYRKDLEDKARIKAGIWNFLHWPKVAHQRKSVQKLGNTYSKKLFTDANETVSVIIPCYNYEKYVGEAIESVQKQTVLPLEIIVIDDGSTDNSVSKIKGYGDGVRLISKKNSGVVETKNLGIKEAKGRWIIFLDADDVLRANYIEECLKTARLTLADMVYTGMRMIGAETGYFRSREFSLFELQLGNYINNSALMKKEILESVGGYKKEMSEGFEDWELYLTLGEAKVRAELVPQMLLRYRRHQAGGRDAMASDRFERILISIKRLHPKLFTRRFYLLVRLRKVLRFTVRIPGIVWHRFNRFINQVYFIRKVKGIIKLILLGKFSEISKRSKNQVKSMKDGTIDWEKD